MKNDISYDDVICNRSRLLKANENHIKMLIFEAENYIKDVMEMYEGHIPAVSFSGGKDSTVVSNIVREALQKNDIVHLFADTTLELPETYDYNEKIFRQENMYTPLLVSKPRVIFLFM